MELARTRQRLVVLALLFEGGLGLLALVLGWLFDHSPLARLGRDAVGAAILIGLAGTIPMLLGLLLLERLSWEPLQRLKRLVDERVVPLFRGIPLSHLALIALAAGWGEELLFRGLVQDGLSQWFQAIPYGDALALVIASLLFGVCHWLSTSYAVLTFLMGLYLGSLLLLADHLLAPLLAHALYDFVALVYLVRSRADETSEGEAREGEAPAEP